MKYIFTEHYKVYKEEIKNFVLHFNTEGKDFIVGQRNSIKLFDLNGEKLNIKAFKIPNIINQIAYKFLRKSKAQRSFEYGNKLLELGIGTPKPVAYFEFSTLFLFKKSFYVSEQLECDLTYRELIHDFNYPDYDTILRAFTRFTFSLHEKGVHFLDHSPGNTLIKKNGEGYDFYLVDLNRMNFGEMDFGTRMKNFARLSHYKEMVEVMSDEYAKCIGEDYDKVFNAMWKGVEGFRTKRARKKELKKKFKL
ncbi:lipopolysaccharide kinase InaA family protein [Algibacter pacificus]|uniref:lipopolysaccharide kinase InaA family protein n=1 Tax=Algibacter pacificus TaxID=2599389 RepID=UPI0011C88A1A|nr:lipopolysaccharide kinase InaA family protein [Algibacter pacificus]